MFSVLIHTFSLQVKSQDFILLEEMDRHRPRQFLEVCGLSKMYDSIHVVWNLWDQMGWYQGVQDVQLCPIFKRPQKRSVLRKKCGSALLWKSKSSSGIEYVYPIWPYCHKSMAQSLATLVKRPWFEERCEEGRKQKIPEGVFWVSICEINISLLLYYCCAMENSQKGELWLQMINQNNKFY